GRSGKGSCGRSMPSRRASTRHPRRSRRPPHGILELAKQAVFLCETRDPGEQRRLLEAVLSHCTFDRGSACPTYNKPFDLFVRADETGEWRGRRDAQPLLAVFSLSEGARLFVPRASV